MQTLTKHLIESQLTNRAISDAQLSRLLIGSSQRRYNLVNRAMKAGELYRLRRGSYLLADDFRDYPPHPFALAQTFIAGSYVSFETALAHHGWIPEAVFSVTSVSPYKKSMDYVDEKFGRFSFHPLAINAGYFLEMVERQQVTEQTMLIAEPFRALMDLVCLRKTEWQGLQWLVDGLRIDYDLLRTINSAQIRTMEAVYKQRRVKCFLEKLARELGND